MKFVLIILLSLNNPGTSPSRPLQFSSITAEFNSYKACAKAYSEIYIKVTDPRDTSTRVLAGSGCYAKGTEPQGAQK